MTKLETVEVGRGVAAAAVVAFHANASAAYVGLASTRWASPLQYGVDFFFVLSGFIIFHVHRGDIGGRARAIPYAIKRFVRLFPLLWLVAIGLIVMRTAMGEAPTSGAVATSLLLYPSLDLPLPGVAWTLRHEMLFYAAFLLAILSRRAGIALFAAWIFVVLYQMFRIAAGNPMDGVSSMIFSSFVLDFAFGAFIALVGRKWVVSSWWPLLAGSAMVLLFAYFSVELGIDRIGPLDYTSTGNLYVPLNGLAFAVVLFGLLCIEEKVRVPRWALLLGSASYAIYLVHTPVSSISQHVGVRLGEGFGHAFIFAAGIAAGIAVHLAVERPMTGYLRRKLLVTPRTGSDIKTRGAK